MDLVLSNDFSQLSTMDEMLVEGGDWAEFGYAALGTVSIAAAPIALAAGQPWAAVALVGNGLYQFGNL
ncbi:hypothetical protein SAMN04487829_1059 [Pseudobutyrivibrio sp. NOR37]|uniref:Uncharacterized protein n=1 Tax=Pseudobutyrivibrio xylanivorans TaxID=185007 RepID=A0A6M0LG87_PSEXY|nr:MULTISPECIES: hypothetical protein [Pseudobutyrivibrio]NEX01466.1 hypothetical protein [Pseudobutyrivibrio xylanivorans]SFR67712.1 hypothetical protein SAMN04487829_1059 [Pseudobutyrivibrio sp. NOR37]